jgi:hypothetical protein
MAVLRLCAGYDELPREECVCPERCVERHCSRCRRPVHYDPRASIPLLGDEVIVCGTCLDRYGAAVTEGFT